MGTGTDSRGYRLQPVRWGVTRREAKRLACYVASDWISGMCDIRDVQSSEDERGNELPLEDVIKLRAALADLADELERRWMRGPCYADRRDAEAVPHD